MIIPNIREHKKCSKPPTSNSFTLDKHGATIFWTIPSSSSPQMRNVYFGLMKLARVQKKLALPRRQNLDIIEMGWPLAEGCTSVSSNMAGKSPN